MATIITNACAQVAAETRAYVMAEYDKQLDRLTTALHATLRDYVHGLVSAELGPLSTPPTPAPTAPPPSTPLADAPPETTAPAPAPEAAVAAPPLRVDIVGLVGSNLGEVRGAARRIGIDATFIDPDQTARWEPGPQVILARKFVPHAARRKAEKAGSHIMVAAAGAQSVIGILESMRGEVVQ
jgi:hypothetical protein